MMIQRPSEHASSLSAEELNAFVDDELCAADRQRVRAQIKGDAALTQQVCNLDQLQDWVREAYATPPLPPRRRVRHRLVGAVAWLPLAAAALLLLGLGGVFGWLVAKETLPMTPVDAPVTAQAAPASTTEARHILVRWGSDAPQKAQESLAMVKALLAQSAHEPGFRLEVLANAEGVKLLSTADSPYAAEIADLVRRYPNVRFLACGNSLQNLEKSGQRLQLLPHVEITPSAVEQVASRLREGWSYLSI
ncbi:DsrE family protein [Halothiobacillus sp. DCM-1]|uniref:DsrE family protein n=1 Tax=Halothiobacillus sp. DCM-1 TaxID=3112558 RepID=UPI00324DB680